MQGASSPPAAGEGRWAARTWELKPRDLYYPLHPLTWSGLTPWCSQRCTVHARATLPHIMYVACRTRTRHRLTVHTTHVHVHPDVARAWCDNLLSMYSVDRLRRPVRQAACLVSNSYPTATVVLFEFPRIRDTRHTHTLSDACVHTRQGAALGAGEPSCIE